MSFDTVDQLAVQTIRTLCIDGVEQANSGHPGLPMGAAPMAYALWTRVMKVSGVHFDWPNRDRFVLSAGHGSMLLYSLLHLHGYDVSLDDLKEFRQFGSKTPGHPEYGHVPGVETTTGPLGQGFANGVGMAIAERHLASVYNRPDYDVVNHYTYVLVGDGDLMEGVAAEAASLAGHLRLGKLIVLYDSNQISLDGGTEKAFTEDVAARFQAYGWQVLQVADGNNLEEITRTLVAAREFTDAPTIVEVRTQIGYGSPHKAGTSAAHGAPLGADETRLTKQSYGWNYEEPFTVPNEVRQLFAEIQKQQASYFDAWNAVFTSYKAAYPQLAAKFEQALARQLPNDLADVLPSYSSDEPALATRQASGQAIQALADKVPTLIGGSADLASSNETRIKKAADFQPDSAHGRNLWFGVREHAMGAILNGLSLHGGLRAYGGTFLVFSDYLRPAIRMSALMQQPVVYVFTHDSIGVGEDGPTHQPVEHVTSLRAIPQLTVLRPGDANETAAAWRCAISSEGAPTALILTRQKLPILPGTKERAMEGVAKGAYVLVDPPQRTPIQGIFLATGSELSLVYDAHLALLQAGIATRVVSMPSWELFALQPEEYQEHVLPPDIQGRLAVEMGITLGWERYVGSKGKVLGINRFGASGPADKLLPYFGFTVENVVVAMRGLVESTQVPSPV